jgi:hypothetical protein
LSGKNPEDLRRLLRDPALRQIRMRQVERDDAALAIRVLMGRRTGTQCDACSFCRRALQGSPQD